MPVVVTTRAGKGSILLTAEIDQNWTDLQDAVNIARVETTTETSVAITAGSKRVIMCDATAASMVVTLPPAASSLDEIYYIKKVDGTDNTVTVDGDTTDTIDDDLTQVIRDQWEGLAMVSDGAEWFVIAKKSNAPLTVGVKTTTTTVANTIAETLIYSYQFTADAFAPHEKVISSISGAYSNASPNDDFQVIVKMNGVIMHTLSRIGSGKINAGWKLKVDGTIRTIGVAGTYVDISGLSDGENTFTQALATDVIIDTTVPILYEVFVKWDNADVGNTFACTQGSMTLIR